MYSGHACIVLGEKPLGRALDTRARKRLGRRVTLIGKFVSVRFVLIVKYETY